MQATLKPATPACLKVVGVGGGGSNAVDHMIQFGMTGVEFIVANTDLQSLERSEAPTRLQLGPIATAGLGAGGAPDIGAKAAEESRKAISVALTGADVVFVAAGMGGGTGTGAAPVIADVARSMGALTIAVVTRPFTWEGMRRLRAAELGLARLREVADTVIIVSNDRLANLVDSKLTLDMALRVGDDVLRQAIQGISELVTQPGLINLDLADLRDLLTDAGPSLLAIGQGRGPDAAISAARAALVSPLVDPLAIQGAGAVLINITCGPDLPLLETQAAVDVVACAARPEADVRFGILIDERMAGRVQVMLVASSLEHVRRAMPYPAAAPGGSLRFVAAS
ncbi:MAG: cell division protein FtsZ [Anaerolineae bacterium]